MTQAAASADPTTKATSAEGAPAPAERPKGGGESNTRILKALVLGPVVKENLTTGESRELPPDDMITSLTADGKMLAPPFDKLILAMLPEQSTELGQVIAAMVTNIDGFGHRFESRVKMDDPSVPPELKKEVDTERAKLLNFFNHCCPDYSFTELRRRTRYDIESTGEGFWEVIRVPTTGEIVEFNHIPSYQVNLGVQDKAFTQYKRTVPMIQPDGSVKLAKLVSSKRFRRFIQSRMSAYARGFGFARGGWEVRYFKEFGDPRVIDNRDGEVVTDPAKVAALAPEHHAGELIHWKHYSPRTPYGMPRFIGNLITLFGDRAADEVNYITLKNNNIPSMMILVSNGQLTQASVDRVSQFVESQIQGSTNYSRFLLLEAEGSLEGQETANIKLDIKPLTTEQMRDQLFQEYGKNNRDKIRENFRLPPIFVGRAEDYTRATAEASRRLADEQVFSPDRDEFDNTVNLRILSEMGIVFHSFVSNGPNITDDEDLTNLIDSAERSGGMTPRLARRIIADILSIDEHALPPLDPAIKPDVPYSFQLAEVVKNQAEPSHQLAVKGLGDHTNAVAVLRSLLKFKGEVEDEQVKRRKEARK